MDTTPEILIGGNQVFTFKQYTHDKSGLPTGQWFTILPIKGLEIEYSFEEKIFKEWQSDNILIRWELIQQIADTVLENIDSLLQKSETMLITLHKQIFGNEYEEKQGYFEFLSIEITAIRNDHWYEFDLTFCLESHSNYLMDPYFSYYVRFKNESRYMLTLVGTRRE